MRFFVSTILLSWALSAGCVHRAGVSSDALPLKKVVVYRNGVGYFERAGTVDTRTVEFNVRPEHVGDFLATLSVVEAGGSSVQSASFPIATEDGVEVDPDDHAAVAAAIAEARALKRVVLKLDGERHDLRVGYVSEQPVWRPSYRLVFVDDGKPMLQAWGIVQNISGEDWTDVTLSLVAGAPIAFESTLATPMTPQRPIVSDSGELISAVPKGENTYAERSPEPAPSADAPGLNALGGMAPPTAQPTPPMPPPSPKAERRRSSRAPGATQGFDDFAQPSGPASTPPSSMPRNLALLASTQVQSGATRYDLPQPVTIPDGSATMVLLTARVVPGEAVFMFAPDYGVPDSSKHPFRVVRFTNDTPGMLEKGPIAVIEAGAFLGQGVLEPLAAAGEATVPFALERSLAVDRDQKSEQQASRLARIEASVLTLERDQVLKTTYRVRNGQPKTAKLIIRHGRQHGTRLHASPAGTEDRVGQNNALVPANVGGNGQVEVTVDERRAFQTTVDWMSDWANEAVVGYLADKRADPKLAGALKETWAVRDELILTRQQLARVDRERSIVSSGAEETRQNLNSLKRNSGKAVNDLRQKLAVRLAELDKRNADLLQRSTELSLKENELRIRFEDKVRELKLDAPLTAPAA